MREAYHTDTDDANIAAKAEMYRHGISFKEANERLVGLLGGGRDIMLRNDNDGEEARLSKSSIGKLVSNSAVNKSINNGFARGQHYAVVSDIENLFKASLKLYEHPDKGENLDITFHRFATPLYLEDIVAYITVKESKQYGKRMYTAELIKIEELVGMLEEAREKSPTHFPITNSSLKTFGGVLEEAMASSDHIPSPSSGKHKGMLEEAGGVPLHTSRAMCFHTYNISKLLNAVNTQTKIFSPPTQKESL